MCPIPPPVWPTQVDATMECGAGLMTVIFLVVLGEMQHSDVLVLLNKNAGVQFGLLKIIHDAHFLTFVLNRTWRAWVGCFLGVLHFHTSLVTDGLVLDRSLVTTDYK